MIDVEICRKLIIFFYHLPPNFLIVNVMIVYIENSDWDRIDEDYFYQKWLEDSQTFKEYIAKQD